METQEERALRNEVDKLKEMLRDERQEHALEVAQLEGRAEGLERALQIATTIGVTYE